MNSHSFDFDEIVEFRGHHSEKWDGMEKHFGIPADEGLAMWVADMDFRAPPPVVARVRNVAESGIFTYFGDLREYHDSIIWWMRERHGWQIESEAIFTTHGLVNAVALCIEAYTKPGDGVVVMSPVYHAFARVVRANDRQLVECPLAVAPDGTFRMDFDRWDGMMAGRERMLILCSPHNPGGRVWTAEELRGVADFARRHDLILVSDEIHHDLVFPGHRHVVMPLADPGIADRLVVLSATSKSFNVAGMHCGNAIIHDPDLRAAFARQIARLAISPNAMSLHMTPALYSPEGAAWLDACVAYLDGNHKAFRDGVQAIPGVRMAPMQGTYLAWVDFSGTGMDQGEIAARVAGRARIAASPGPVFGRGGDQHLRFNLAMPRARIEEAVARLQAAFGDLQ